MRPPPAPALVHLYAAGSSLLAPVAYARVKARLRAHGTRPGRFGERLGHATLPRPPGRLLWFHAASVGESLSVLRLITHMGAEDPGLHFLLTSGTPSSADLIAARLPPRCLHQFAPLDSRRAVARFLAHWHPDAGVFVESELWPNMLRLSARAGLPLALLNARISERSARNWKRFARIARHVLGHFRLIHCQDARSAAHFHDLGLTHAVVGQNLKAAAGPLPVESAALAELQNHLAERPIWVASSTHPGEEEILLQAHCTMLKRHPTLLLILVPRHPERGDALMRLLSDHRLTAARRTAQEMPAPHSQVYLADTLGETGLWYALSPIVALAGSFTPVGGHNPYEPAHAGAAILHGPLYANFARAYQELDKAGGGLEVTDAPALAKAVTTLLEQPETLRQIRARASRFAAAQDSMLDTLTTQLVDILELRPVNA